MEKSEFLSRRALISAGGVGATGLVAAAAMLESTPAQAETTTSCCTCKNVLDYGVTLGSGSNQAALIQDALDDLATNDCLIFPPGIYNVGTGVLLLSGKNNIHIQAYGAVFQVTDNGTAHHDVLRLSNAQNIAISGLKISSYLTTAGSGIVVENSTRLVLRDLNIWNMGEYCLDASESWWLSTYSCQFLAAGIASVRQETHMNTALHVGTRFAPYAYETSGGNPINTGAVGILHSHGSSVTFVGCDFSISHIGADIRWGNNVTFQGCYFETVGTGIALGNGTYVVCNATVDTCYFSLPDDDVVAGVVAVDVLRAQSVLVRNNYVRTYQKATTATVKYNNSNAANKNVVIDANGYLDATAGVEYAFASSIVHTAVGGTPDLVKKYSLTNA